MCTVVDSPSCQLKVNTIAVARSSVAAAAMFLLQCLCVFVPSVDNDIHDPDRGVELMGQLSLAPVGLA